MKRKHVNFEVKMFSLPLSLSLFLMGTVLQIFVEIELFFFSVTLPVKNTHKITDRERERVECKCKCNGICNLKCMLK